MPVANTNFNTIITPLWDMKLWYTYSNRSMSLIPQCTCPISHNTPFRTEICTFLFWMVYCGIWDRCIMGFVKHFLLPSTFPPTHPDPLQNACPIACLVYLSNGLPLGCCQHHLGQNLLVLVQDVIQLTTGIRGRDPTWQNVHSTNILKVEPAIQKVNSLRPGDANRILHIRSTGH